MMAVREFGVEWQKRFRNRLAARPLARSRPSTNNTREEPRQDEGTQVGESQEYRFQQRSSRWSTSRVKDPDERTDVSQLARTG